ncbi:hypothetical protein K449DRAFT_274710 [Hypoxylon sp. EC38]|nr:hypothetical protein K449DRAFT_274710 [Hypoxylon sp. EC38]
MSLCGRTLCLLFCFLSDLGNNRSRSHDVWQLPYIIERLQWKHILQCSGNSYGIAIDQPLEQSELIWKGRDVSMEHQLRTLSFDMTPTLVVQQRQVVSR